MLYQYILILFKAHSEDDRKEMQTCTKSCTGQRDNSTGHEMDIAITPTDTSPYFLSASNKKTFYDDVEHRTRRHEMNERAIERLWNEFWSTNVVIV